VLQRRVSLLEAHPPAGHPLHGSPLPFTAYLPLRRSLSARASLLSPTPGPSSCRPPSAPSSAAPLRPWSAVQEATQPSPHPLAPGAGQAGQQISGSSSSSSSSTALQDIPQVLLPPSSTSRECQRAPDPAVTATQQPWDEGEVDEVLQVLEASELRRSRGMAGLRRLQQQQQAQQQSGQATSPAAVSRTQTAAAGVRAAYSIPSTVSPAKAESSRLVAGGGRVSPSVGLGAFRAGGPMQSALSRGPVAAGSVRGSPHGPRRQ
jgi:hypothetical protein